MQSPCFSIWNRSLLAYLVCWVGCICGFLGGRKDILREENKHQEGRNLHSWDKSAANTQHSRANWLLSKQKWKMKNQQKLEFIFIESAFEWPGRVFCSFSFSIGVMTSNAESRNFGQWVHSKENRLGVCLSADFIKTNSNRMLNAWKQETMTTAILVAGRENRVNNSNQKQYDIHL